MNNSTITKIIVIIIIIVVCLLIFRIINHKNDKRLVHPIEKHSFPFEIFVINLDRKPERFEYVIRQLKDFKVKRWTNLLVIKDILQSHKS